MLECHIQLFKKANIGVECPYSTLSKKPIEIVKEESYWGGRTSQTGVEYS